MALVGVVALIVIGPEAAARGAHRGHLAGQRRSVTSDVKSEVNRSMELDELKENERNGGMPPATWNHRFTPRPMIREGLGRSDQRGQRGAGGSASGTVVPAYHHPGKNWRLKRGAVPQWYKSRNGVRAPKAQSGAARVLPTGHRNSTDAAPPGAARAGRGRHHSSTKTIQRRSN